LPALLNRVPFGKFNRVKFKFAGFLGHGYLVSVHRLKGSEVQGYLTLFSLAFNWISL
jgi:hypothetical protein